MTFMRLPQAIPLAIVLASGVWAQSNVAGCPAGFDWNKNSFGQDPCQIASMLDASCRGLAAFTIPLLNSSQYYLPPGADASGDVMCDCNTVMYSLYMACASCQGGQVYSWVQWISQCDGVHVMQYPVVIAQDTAVPRWAYYDITSIPGQTWDDTFAMDIGGGFQLMARQVDNTSPSGVPTSTNVSTVTTLITVLPPPTTTTSIRPEPLGSSDGGEKPPTATTEDPKKSTSIRTPGGSTANSSATLPTATSSVKPSTITSSMEPTTGRQDDGNSANSILRSSIGSVALLLILTVLAFL